MNSQSDRALVTVGRDLVVNAIRSAGNTEIGVSTNWLVKHARELMLKPEEVETLVYLRVKFNGSLPHVMRLLRQGLSVDDAYGCYYTRNLLANLNLDASVKKIAALIRVFPEADPDNESLGGMIAKAHEVIEKKYFWVKYVDQSIYILCEIAKEYGCATIDGALAIIDNHHSREAGLLPDDEKLKRRHPAVDHVFRRFF